MSPSTTSKVTTDHSEVRQWAEQRGAKPAAAIRAGSDDDSSIIRLDLPGYSGEGSLEEICWDDWFGKFDEHGLALLYQEQTAGGEKSDFNKIISRDTAEEVNSAVGGKGRSASDKGNGNNTKAKSESRPKTAARASLQPKPSENTSRNGDRRGKTTKQKTTKQSTSAGGPATARSRVGEKRASNSPARSASRNGESQSSTTTSRSASGIQQGARGSSTSRARSGNGSGSISRNGSRSRSISELG